LRCPAGPFGRKRPSPDSPSVAQNVRHHLGVLLLPPQVRGKRVAEIVPAAHSDPASLRGRTEITVQSVARVNRASGFRLEHRTRCLRTAIEVRQSAQRCRDPRPTFVQNVKI